MNYINTQESALFPPMSGCNPAVGVLHHTLSLSRSILSTGYTELTCRSPQKVLLHSPQVVPSTSGGGVLFIDLFAARNNRKCHQFCSLWGQNPGSLTDTFLLAWTAHLYYTFPSIQLVHKVLLKIKQDRGQAILIAPVWPRQHWFITMSSLSAETPIRLPLHSDLIFRDNSWLLHLNLSSLYLMAWNLHD